MEIFKILYPFIFMISSVFLYAKEEVFVQRDNVQLWSESFGERKNPALLLVMAGGVQGIMWPQEFCERLSNEGFFVIRYDHRDMGLSSSVDYEKNPYDLMDLAKDAIAVLTAHNIDQAHVAGISMGGNIAILLSVHFPERILTIAPINTTRDLRSFLRPDNSSLPKPKKEYFLWKEELNAALERGISNEEKIRLHLKGWEILCGGPSSFDAELYRNLITQAISRMQNPKGFANHTAAMAASSESLVNVTAKVQVPTLVIHGSNSPMFSKEHAVDLALSIPGAKLESIDGMGHFLSPKIYNVLINSLKTHVAGRGIAP